MELERQEQETVTCLEKTFESEEERREYFREELRKKLPELKEMDGFPIGEDEDIIELSDPPYYTACPNPWLEDIIQDWENEKVNLLKKGKRNEDITINEPFAYDISEGKRNAFYLAHTYHTKSPHPAIMRYILHYTQPGDIIFDGFVGTGMTGVASHQCANPKEKDKHKIEEEWSNKFDNNPNWGQRNNIGAELSTQASFIAHNYNKIIDVEKFIDKAEKIIDKLEEEFSWMYKTNHTKHKEGKIKNMVWSEIFICNECSKEYLFWDVAVNLETGKVAKSFKCPHCNAEQTKRSTDRSKETIYDKYLDETLTVIKTKPVYIYYRYNGESFEKEPDKDDLRLIEKIKKAEIPYWFPKNEVPTGDKTREPLNLGYKHIHQLYSDRTLSILSYIHHLCDDNATKLLFSSQLINLSKLNRHRLNVTYPYNPFSGTMYISSMVAEANVITAYKNKLKRIVKALRKVNENNVVSTQSSTQLSNIPSASVDYIFTDPPFGANLMYSELNLIWESWLKVRTQNQKEVIQNKTQNKDVLKYQNLMTKCFNEFERILKPGKWMTVEFSNTKASVWNGIQTAIQKAGFVLADVSALDKKQGTFNAVTNPTSVKQDLIISCYKPKKEFESELKKDSEDIAVWDFIDDHLKHLPKHLKKENSTTTIIERSAKILYDRLISFYVTRGLPVPIDSKDFQAELKQRYAERDGMYFTQEQVSEYDEKKAKTTDFVQLSLNVANENEGIEWLRAELQDQPQTYQDLHPKWMKATTAVSKRDILPELRTILEQNFIKKENGQWRVPNMEEAKDREALRTRALLKEFEEYVVKVTGKGAKKLKEARIEALRAGFKNCWDNKDFETIVKVSDMLYKKILLEDDQLLMYYDIATDRV